MKRNHLSHRSVISLRGSERCSFLQGLVTNDVETLTPHACCWAAMLNAQGRIQSLFFLWKDDEQILLDIAEEQAEPLIKILRRFRLRADVQIELTEHGILTGPPEHAAPAAALLHTIDPRHPSLGWRAIMPHRMPDEATSQDSMGQNATGQSDEPALLTRRLQAGVPDDADIIPGQTLVLEADMDHLNGVSWKKGCYLGQEVTARTHYRGLIKKRILPVIATNGEALEGNTTLITHEGREVGELRSHEGRYGLAVLHRRVWDGAALMLGNQPLTLTWPDWLPRNTDIIDTDTTEEKTS